MEPPTNSEPIQYTAQESTCIPSATIRVLLTSRGLCVVALADSHRKVVLLLDVLSAAGLDPQDKNGFVIAS